MKIEREKKNICTHLGDDYDQYMGAIVPPIYQNTLFTRKNKNHGYTYTRVSNPTIEIAERKIAALEHGEAARCFSSGMAAISAVIIHYLSAGSHVIAVRNVYPPVRFFLETYLKRFGVEITFITGENAEEFEKSICPRTKLIYLESPASNIFTMQDLKMVSKLAKAHGITTVIDNTWATPIFQNPLDFGIDLVIHSATKYLGGHSDILAGTVIGSKEAIEQISKNERELFGAVMDPHQAWLLTRSLRTLPVRMKQHGKNAMAVANFLEVHKKVERVLFPGLKSHPQYELGKKQMKGCSGLMSFVPKGDYTSISGFMRKLALFEIGPSWGGFESLINSPGLGLDDETSMHTGIPKGLVRISVGLEDSESLIEDLDQALSIL